jgi:hypothetical protein
VVAVAKADLLAPGARVGRYQLLRRLAIGGMAELHLACAIGVGGFQKVVVLKRVLPHLAADAGFVRMFLDEARLAAHLDHPNVVQVLDTGEAEGEFYYAMEYVHGKNGRELLGAASHAGGMPLAVALTIATGVAAALDHAHCRVDLEGRPMELVHRDVSPANVLVSYDGAVKLTDFGIAKAVTRSQETTAGMLKGKIGYMSPEQCRGERVDRKSDIFSLGVVLFELTTCERLFYADSDFAVLNKVVAGRFDPPTQRVPGYPPALERIVLTALALDPAARHPSADALRRDLEAFAHDHGIRLGADALAQWLRGLYGAPPYPRVELRPAAADDPLEIAPTLVLVEDEPTVPRAAEVEPTTQPPSRPRRSAAWLPIGLALAAGLGVGAWAVSQREVEAEAADPPPTIAAPAPASATAPVPDVAEDGSRAPVVERPPAQPAAATTPAPATTRATGKRSSVRSDPRPRSRAREREKPTPTPREQPRDLDALYPDKK